MMPETSQTRVKRLKMRSWRRGTKEMDLILGPYSDSQLEAISTTDLDRFENLLNENDQDLYQWVTGAVTVPPAHAPILNKIKAFHGI